MECTGKKRKIEEVVTDAPAAAAAASSDPPSKGEKNSQGETYFPLNKKKRVTIRKFKGMTLVDIREYYEKDDEMKPGRKGISLTVEQWRALSELVDPINEAVAEISEK